MHFFSSFLTYCLSSERSCFTHSAHVCLTWHPKAFSCLLLVILLSKAHIRTRIWLICNCSLSINSSVIKGLRWTFCRWSVLLSVSTVVWKHARGLQYGRDHVVALTEAAHSVYIIIGLLFCNYACPLFNKMKCPWLIKVSDLVYVYLYTYIKPFACIS